MLDSLHYIRSDTIHYRQYRHIHAMSHHDDVVKREIISINVKFSIYPPVHSTVPSTSNVLHTIRILQSRSYYCTVWWYYYHIIILVVLHTHTVVYSNVPVSVVRHTLFVWMRLLSGVWKPLVLRGAFLFWHLIPVWSGQGRSNSSLVLPALGSFLLHSMHSNQAQAQQWDFQQLFQPWDCCWSLWVSVRLLLVAPVVRNQCCFVVVVVVVVVVAE